MLRVREIDRQCAALASEIKRLLREEEVLREQRKEKFMAEYSDLMAYSTRLYDEGILPENIYSDSIEALEVIKKKVSNGTLYKIREELEEYEAAEDDWCNSHF